MLCKMEIRKILFQLGYAGECGGSTAEATRGFGPAVADRRESHRDSVEPPAASLKFFIAFTMQCAIIKI